MAQRKTLNEIQVAVLRWVGEGCPDNGVDGVPTRISAGALRNRGFVRTSGRGPSWKATITAEGREYLKEVDGSHPPLPRQPNVSVTQQLVNDVIAAGGFLRVPRKHWNDRDGVDYERRARLAESYGKVPSGSRLVVKNALPDELLIELVTDGLAVRDKDSDAPSELDPVRVPTRLSKYRPVAREFRERTPCTRFRARRSRACCGSCTRSLSRRNAADTTSAAFASVRTAMAAPSGSQLRKDSSSSRSTATS